MQSQSTLKRRPRPCSSPIEPIIACNGSLLKGASEDSRWSYRRSAQIPGTLHQRGTDIVVGDLAGRITILDRNNKLVTHLGDNVDPRKRDQ
ncbi:MAG: hypothetical protein IPJ07_26825 [Acidobacteria bacterium]|nr:hypothetical protein [Acidobacteriota bacterium]